MEENNNTKQIKECRAELVEMVINLDDDEARYIHRLISLLFPRSTK